MTLILDGSSGIRGHKIEAKTENYLAPESFLHLSDGGNVHIDDACALIEYILTNTDLIGENDPRVELVKQIKEMDVVRGYNGDGSRRFAEGTKQTRIITLCGSTRYTAEMLDEAWRLTKEGNIVIHWSILNGKEAFAHGAEREGGEALKKVIDELYLRKIEMADEVRVINVDGYIGESTRSEVRHAIKIGKPVTWLEPDRIPEL